VSKVDILLSFFFFNVAFFLSFYSASFFDASLTFHSFLFSLMFLLYMNPSILFVCLSAFFFVFFFGNKTKQKKNFFFSFFSFFFWLFSFFQLFAADSKIDQTRVFVVCFCCFFWCAFGWFSVVFSVGFWLVFGWFFCAFWLVFGAFFLFIVPQTHQMKQWQVVGRKRPVSTEDQPEIYRMKVFAVNEVCAKSRFWCVPGGGKWGVFICKRRRG
jgi:hypothetical protein